MNEVLEPVTFVLAYRTVCVHRWLNSNYVHVYTEYNIASNLNVHMTASFRSTCYLYSNIPYERT